MPLKILKFGVVGGSGFVIDLLAMQWLATATTPGFIIVPKSLVDSAQAQLGYRCSTRGGDRKRLLMWCKAPEQG